MRVLGLGFLIAILWAPPAWALSISVTDDASNLAGTLLGSGITLVGTPTYLGAAEASGTFSGGTLSVLGFESGILLTSGNAADADGPNQNSIDSGDSFDDTSTDWQRDGDLDLGQLAGIDPYDPDGNFITTYDAAILEFDFVSGNGDLFFNYVFASEEYLDWVDTEFNDVFGFFVDGTNIALVPGTATPVSINTVNPFVNSAFYIDNLAPASYGLEYDGFTSVMTAAYPDLGAGTHHIKIAVADASDGILDAAVFIQAGTFSDTPTSVPEPSTLLLLGAGIGGLAVFRRFTSR